MTATWPGSLLVANSRLTRLLKGTRNLAQCCADGGSRSLHHKQTLALPDEVEHGSLTTLWEELIKIGAKIVRHGCYITFQLAEVAIPRALFAKILCLIDGLRPAPLPP